MNRTLIIRHLPDENKACPGLGQFLIEKSTGKISKRTTISAPDEIIVEGRPKFNLLQDLAWYLENFLDYPYSPNTEIAQRIITALENWGEDTFAKLFVDRARDWFQDARRAGLKNLTIKIASDDPRILAWPWESLKDPEGTTLAHVCNIVRQLNELHDPLPLPESLPTDCLNILLIIARPKEQDVGYHAISRPLVELAAEHHLPINVDVLRPPTFKQLRKTLADKTRQYHIVHFDGHGGYGDFGQVGGVHALKGVSGKLLFENDDGGVDLVTAEMLTALLTEFNFPIMVLNACQSARIDDRADDPFASVAAALLKAGIRSVVAMGYSLYVSGAKQFVPAFYERLFGCGEVAEAVRSGRGEMLANPDRQCLIGEAALADWMVPVLYQQAPVTLEFVQQQTDNTKTGGIELPQDAALGDYGFIGRDSTILRLERRSRLQPQAAILIHGMAGVGKTTMVKGYLHWLQQTNGLSNPPFWFQFDDIRSAEFVVNELVRALLGDNADAAPMVDKIEALTRELKKSLILMIWDNFESAAGIDGTEVTPLLSQDDRELLVNFLQRLRGGKTTVLITSRSPESWLGNNIVYRLPLTGLKGEECWAYCNALVRELGLSIDQKDEAYRGIIEKLDGHPLALQAVLSGLAERSPQTIWDSLERSFDGAESDESTKRIFAALTVLTESFPTEFAEVLQLVGLHERFINIDDVTQMLQISLKADSLTHNTYTLIQQVFTALHCAGLLHEVSRPIYSIHPALSLILHKEYVASLLIESIFIDFMVGYVDHITSMPFYQQKPLFYLHRANFFYALNLAKVKNVFGHIAVLVESMAHYTSNNREFATATGLFELLARLAFANDDSEVEADAYHQLGVIAEEQSDLKGAVNNYTKSLEIKEKQGNEEGAARTYHQLGIIAHKQRDYTTAGGWYKKSLIIKEKKGSEEGAAIAYHQLGMVAEEQRDFTAARNWYTKSLAISERQGDEEGAAKTYHHLGRVAEELRDFINAEDWYRRALAIKEKQGNELGLAVTYHQLSSIAEEQGELIAAGVWAGKALIISEKLGDKRGMAPTCHQLGVIAQKQRDFEAAGVWYRKSLVIFEGLGNEHGAACARYQLGRIAEEQSDYVTASELFTLSVNKYIQVNDSYYLDVTLRSFLRLLTKVKKEQPELERDFIKHFNMNTEDCLPAWSEIEKQLIEQLAKESR